jgi:outer membrane immunogenic protein
MRNSAMMSAAIAFAGIGQATAADLPARYPDRPPAAYSVPYSWSGVYVGLNAGGVFGRFSDDFGDSVSASGLLGGAQFGAQMQMGQIVLGAEADFQGTTQNHGNTFPILGVPVTISEKMPWFGTLRGRFGYAFDRVLVFGTGGVAWVDGKVEASGGGLTLSTEANSIGWTAGGGMEWAFADRWSTKIEYLYLTSTDIKFNTAVGSFNGNIRNNVVRAGLNYRF